MKTAISIPDELFKEADHLAHRLGICRSELYSCAVAEYIGDHWKEAVTEKLNEIYENQPSPVDAVLNTLQFTSLQKDEW
jgi:metal-responsive CopG/Arc/MetJ family transcriptional regulator